MAAQLKGAGVTTLILVTDPALPYFLTGAATQQDYWPEWFMSGAGLTDIDILGQFYDQDQWQFAYGQSFLSDIFQGKDSESYRAYKAVRPKDEPAITRDQYYYSFLMLFIGLQMAGPNLTPDTFAGRACTPTRPAPAASGGGASPPPTTPPVDDAREIYYDRNALSAFNNKPGRWITLNGGRRFRGASWPAEALRRAPIPPGGGAMSLPAGRSSCQGIVARLAHRPVGRGAGARLPGLPDRQLRPGGARLGGRDAGHPAVPATGLELLRRLRHGRRGGRAGRRAGRPARDPAVLLGAPARADGGHHRPGPDPVRHRADAAVDVRRRRPARRPVGRLQDAARRVSSPWPRCCSTGPTCRCWSSCRSSWR